MPKSVLLWDLFAFGEAVPKVLEVCEWPAWYYNAKIKSNPGSCFLDFPEPSTSEGWQAQYFVLGLLSEVGDVQDAVVLPTIDGSSDRLSSLTRFSMTPLVRRRFYAMLRVMSCSADATASSWLA